MKCRSFTLVEVLLALGVVVIGICSIMVLFPVGASAIRDASMETYAANSVEELLSCIKYDMVDNGKWDEYKTGVTELDDTKTDPKERFSGDVEFDDYEESSAWSRLSFNSKGGVYRRGTDYVYQLVCNRGGDGLASDKVDFRAVARLARQVVEISGTPVSENVAMLVNVEVSWPAEIPYDARQKAYYSMEIFRN